MVLIPLMLQMHLNGWLRISFPLYLPAEDFPVVKCRQIFDALIDPYYLLVKSVRLSELEMYRSQVALHLYY